MPPRPTTNYQTKPANFVSKPQTQASKTDPKAVPPPDARRLTSEQFARAQRVNSNIRKILLTSPAFPRLYADVVLRYAPNSHEAMILRPDYQKFARR
jgi:hypothetical protein